MSALEDRLARMGYTLPPPFKFPNPNRTGCVVVGTIVFVSGHGRDLPSLPDVKHAGKVGRDLTVEEGYATARAVALSMLASLKQQLGDLDRIKRIARLFGMVKTGAALRSHAAGDRRCIGSVLRAARRTERPARAVGGRARGAPARHSGRDQRGI